MKNALVLTYSDGQICPQVLTFKGLLLSHLDMHFMASWELHTWERIIIYDRIHTQQLHIISNQELFT